MNKKIVVAGGCFWGLEDLIRTKPGVIGTEVGYTCGKNEDPTYENHPGHAEAVEIEYDSTKHHTKNFSISSFKFTTQPPSINKEMTGERLIGLLFFMETKKKERRAKILLKS